MLEASGAGGFAGVHAGCQIARAKLRSLVARCAPAVERLVSGSRAARIQLRVDPHLARAESRRLGAGEVGQATVVVVLTRVEWRLTSAWPGRLGVHIEGAV
jgi:hypothetical protein